MSKHPLQKIIAAQKQGIPVGIYSACTANELVIEAVMERALRDQDDVLIEATSNQVNQYGGYTGMKPADFRDFAFAIAAKVHFPKEKIILGGDHLGPLTWKHLTADKALAEARELVKQFVLAGFTKIHIDTSMHLADDDKKRKLETEVIAERGALLCEAAEQAYTELRASRPDAVQPVYVVGSEVPIPGGSEEAEEGIQVTKVSDFEETVRMFQAAFARRNLQSAWEAVIAVVVQPGVEFGDETIHEYNRAAAKDLTQALKKYPNLVFEGHSTDYQTPQAFEQMVADGIAILKVGPALTFALREGLFALNQIENELFQDAPEIKRSDFIKVLEAAMVQNPENWQKHYHGSADSIRLARKYSFSDRCRYYLPVPEVKAAIDVLLRNLKSVQIPLTLISQYLPVQYTKIRAGLLRNNPESLAKDRVVNCIDEYLYGVKP